MQCGYVAIIGRPNVGKSTLLNRILGQKISIVSPKPQTTRHRILGIKTQGETQIIYVDTPGLHRTAKRAINRYMNRTASHAVRDVDVILFMVEALAWKADDEWILKRISQASCPIILVVNKVDEISDKEKLLPYIESVSVKFNFADIIPISARKGTQVDKLESVIEKFLPQGPFLFGEDQVTDKSSKFIAAEIIREKLLYIMQQEVPYALTVEIEQFERKGNILHIAAVIWVERPGQKKIIIGTAGENLKQIGTQARLELEKILETKIFLKLWVKVKENWSDSERALRSLGYSEG